MDSRIWIFLGAVLGAAAVAAGAAGAHALPDSTALAAPVRIFNTAQLFHSLHALALVGTGSILWMTEGRRASWSGIALHTAAGAFTLGILCFSGGIYVQIARELPSMGGLVPFGGISLLTGWLSLAAGALGLSSRVTATPLSG